MIAWRIEYIVVAGVGVNVLAVPASEPPARMRPRFDSLLATKFAPPALRSPCLIRPRLTTQLVGATQTSLTLIAAPAGFGKTALLTEWLSKLKIENGELKKGFSTLTSQFSIFNSQFKVAWLSLDAADSDPAHFWRCVISALQAVGPEIGASALARLEAQPPATFEGVLTELLNDLAHRPQELVLVLDDYHLIDSPAVHESLAFLLDHLPACLHLIIATRVVPPLPLARLRARGQLAELGAADLRLTDEEAAALLRDVLRLPLHAADIATLATRCEGWMTGLHLAALALHDQPDPAAFVRTFSGSHGAVADYLIDDVLARQPADIQSFLSQTALLDRLSAPLCAAVTGRDDSAALLAWLEQANLFIAPIDEARRWYRYQRLFAEALGARYAQAQPQEARAALRRAWRWYAGQGMVAEAIPHALAAGDWEEAADLIARLAEPLWLRGDVTTLLGWLHALPDAAVQARPALRWARAFAQLAAGQLAGVAADVQALSDPGSAGIVDESLFRAFEVGQARAAPAPESPPWLRESAAALHVLVATLQDADPWSLRQLRQVFNSQPNLPQSEHQIACLNRGFAHWAHGQVVRARAAFTGALHTCRRGGDRHGEVLATSFLAELYVAEGRLRQAGRLYDQAARLLDRPEDRRAPVASLPAIGLGMLCYEWNELERARQLIEVGLEQAERGGRMDVVIAGLIMRAKIAQASGDAAGAGATQEQAVQTARATHTPRLIAYAEAQQAALWLNQGADAAVAWARAQSMGLDDEIDYLREFECLIFARALIVQGAYDDALYLLERLRAYAAAAGRHGQVIPVLLATALAYQARGAEAQACDTARQALILAEPGGYVRAFVDAGPALAPALSQACDQLALDPEPKRRHGIPAYARRVRAACQAEWPATYAGTAGREAAPDPPTPQESPARAAPGATGPRLSRREIDLLVCMSAGMSNKEIARQLGLTINTVRWYSSKLYDRLGVRSRTQAIARAKGMGVLR